MEYIIEVLSGYCKRRDEFKNRRYEERIKLVERLLDYLKTKATEKPNNSNGNNVSLSAVNDSDDCGKGTQQGSSDNEDLYQTALCCFIELIGKDKWKDDAITNLKTVCGVKLENKENPTIAGES